MAILAVCCPKDDCADDGPIKVTVVVVLATTDNNTVDKKLTDLAKEVKKLDPKLTGFKLVSSEGKSVAIGDCASFPLVDNQELKVKVEKPTDGKGKVGLTIKPPELGEVKYTCTCDKFFPVVTPYKTAKGETLIVAVMGKPCSQEKEKK
jgi:hypothetical protein